MKNHQGKISGEQCTDLYIISLKAKLIQRKPGTVVRCSAFPMRVDSTGVSVECVCVECVRVECVGHTGL